MAKAGRKALSTAVPPLLGLMVPFPLDAFQWGERSGLARCTGLMTWGSASCPANGRACAKRWRGADVQMRRCADADRFHRVDESNAARWLDLTIASHLLITIVECVTCPTKQRPAVRAVDTCHPMDWCLS